MHPFFQQTNFIMTMNADTLNQAICDLAGSAMHEKVDEQMAALKIIRKTKEATEPADVK